MDYKMYSEELEKIIGAITLPDDRRITVDAFVKQARKKAEGGQDADSHPQWIPVEERLPDGKGRYIVHAERKIVSSTVCEAYYDGKFWYHHGSGAYLNATHWMPLPQPPRKEENDE